MLTNAAVGAYLIITTVLATNWTDSGVQVTIKDMPTMDKCNTLKQQIEQQIDTLRPKSQTRVTCKPA